MNNSRKILNKIFKTGLVTASSLTLLMGSGAFAADMRSAKEDGTMDTLIRVDYREINLETGKGLDTLPPAKHTKFADDSTLQLSNIEAHINTGNQENNICALDLHGQNATLIVEGNIKLGSVVDNVSGSNKKLQVTINDGQALTLTGTGTDNNLKFFSGTEAMPNSYGALGEITLKGNTAKLVINSADRKDITFEVSINGENNNNGNLIINTPAVFTKNISNQHSLNEININATTVTFNGTEIKADKVNLTTAESIFNISNKDVAVLTGDVDNISGQDGKGQLIITGENSRITGNIGATNSLQAISVGEGTTTLQGQVIKANEVVFVADNSSLYLNTTSKE